MCQLLYFGGSGQLLESLHPPNALLAIYDSRNAVGLAPAEIQHAVGIDNWLCP